MGVGRGEGAAHPMTDESMLFLLFSCPWFSKASRTKTHAKKIVYFVTMYVCTDVGVAAWRGASTSRWVLQQWN